MVLKNILGFSMIVLTLFSVGSHEESAFAQKAPETVLTLRQERRLAQRQETVGRDGNDSDRIRWSGRLDHGRCSIFVEEFGDPIANEIASF